MPVPAICPRCQKPTADGLCRNCLLSGALLGLTSNGNSDAAANDAADLSAMPELSARIEYNGQPRPRPVAPEDYELLKPLGEGATATVWLAREARLNRLVALKFISATDDSRLRRRLIREGQAVAQLRHPHIVAVHALRVDDQHAYLAMDFLEGGDLRHRLARQLPSPRESAELVRKLADALVQAHATGLLHRDIKPSNILLDADGEPHLADFGFVGPLEGRGDLTLPGQIAGTASYLAPELLAGSDRSSPLSDIYALGAVLYECLTGRAPFVGGTPAAIFKQRAEQDPASPRSLRSEVPQDLETICLKCLEKVPTRRYPSAEALRNDLARFLRGETLIEQEHGPIDAGEVELRARSRVSPESTAFDESTSKPAPEDAGPNAIPHVPDYELLRRIGHGAYGEVWLARGLTDVYRAVKIVWRHRFPDTEPYQREFRGLKESMAHSLQAGQLALLHVGQNETAGFFYYVMELADDATATPGRLMLDPATYVPLTLRELKARRGRTSTTECLGHAVELARALAVLHARGLVHRDIKPSNVILVNGVPKLADVGLVASAADAQTFVGTQGYLPPEGAGTPAADVFALGKVLYELATGLDHDEFPRLPAEFANPTERTALFELNEVLLRACEPLPQKRYRDANAMLTDLVSLQTGHSPRGRRMWRSAAKIGLLLVGIVAIVAVAEWKFSATSSVSSAPATPISEAIQLAGRARELFQQIDGTRDDYKLAEDLIAQAKMKDPTDAEVSAVEAQLHEQYISRHWDDTDARHEAARAATQRALRLSPRSFEARLAQAALLADADREGEEKEVKLRALRAERPHDQRVLRALATLVGRRGRFDEAIQIAKESAALPGGDPLALYTIAGYYWVSGRSAEAEATISAAIAQQPFTGGLVMSVWFRVVVHGDLEGARAALERVSSAGLQEDRGAFWAYFVALLRRDADEALARLRAVPRDWIDDYFYRGPKTRLAGDALAAAGRAEAAAIEWRAALKLVEERLVSRPNDIMLLSHRVGLLASLGERARANREFDVLMQMVGVDLAQAKRAPFWITRTCILLGRHAEAISQIRRTLTPPGRATQAPTIALERNKPVSTAGYTSRDARFYSAAVLRLDPDFDPLRGEPDFQRLIADFERAEQGGHLSNESGSADDSLSGE